LKLNSIKKISGPRQVEKEKKEKRDKPQPIPIAEPKPSGAQPVAIIQPAAATRLMCPMHAVFSLSS